MITKPEDFYTAIDPCFWVSKQIGLLYLSYKGKKPHRKLVITSLAWLIGTCILRIGIFLMIAFCIAIELEYLAFPENMTGVAIQIELYMGIILTLIEMTSAVIMRKPSINIIEMFIAVDKQMSSNGIAISYNGVRRIAYAEVFIVVVMFLLKLILQVFDNDIAILLINTGINIVAVLNSMMMFQYLNLLLLLRQRFRWLNKAIEEIEQDDIKANLEPISTLILNCEYENTATADLSLSPYIFKKYARAQNLKNLIKTYGKIHNALCDLAGLISDTFGFFVLICILTRFIMICAELIFFYKLWQVQDDGDVFVFVLIIISAFMHCLKLLAVVCTAAAASSAGKGTGISLHTLWDISPEIKEDVQFFSMQVVHQTSQYTAMGFLHLDNTLITSILGSITTYLVIVIQFDLTSSANAKACNQK